MKKGFLLLAQSRPAYLRMAFNLAMSMKHNGSVLPICLLTDRTGYGVEFPSDVFDVIHFLKPEHEHIFYTKTVLNLYSPFEETIFLDVDALCLQNPDSLFDRNDGFRIQVTRRGFKDSDRTTWAEGEKVMQYYGIPPERQWIETNSSIMYFDKSTRAEDCFTIAEELYSANHYPDWKGTRGFYPDELAWNSAIAIMNFDPEFQPFNPIWFVHPNTGVPNFAKLPPDKYFLGLYGDGTTCHFHAWDFYNRSVLEIARQRKHMAFKVSPTEKAQADRSIRKYGGLRAELKNEAVYGKIEQYRKG